MPSGSCSTWTKALRRLALAVALVAFALAFTAVRPPRTPGPFERDFEAYYAAGATVNAGGDPYSRDVWQTERTIGGVVATRDELLPYVGPAAALPLWSLLARLPHPAARIVWSALLALAFVALMLSVLALAGREPSPGTLVAAAGFLFASGPMLSDTALGQVALVSVAAIACALVAYRARAPLGATLATLIAAIQPNLALALIARMRSRFDVLAAAGAAVAFAGLTFAAGGGPHGFTAYLTRLRLHGEAERFILIQHTPAAIAFALGAPRPVALALGAIVALAAVGIAVVAIVRERLAPTDATLVAIAVLPLAVPFFHEHDFTLELIPGLLLACVARGRARALAAIACACVFVDWLGLAQRPPAHGQIALLAIALTALFVALGPADGRELRRGAWGIVTVLVLLAVASPLAHRFPAPTWPDALALTYHADPAADASAVWGEEQRLSGLEAAEPLWGVLRAIPLAGCALLTAAVVANVRYRRSACRRTAPPDSGASS
jgi:hypothetical protein